MTGNRILDIVIGAISVLIAGFAFYVFYMSSVTLFDRPTPDASAELAALKREGMALSFPRTYDLKSIVVNLKSRTKRLRFLEVDMHITPFDEMDTEKFETHKHILRDEIITLAGGMFPNELNSVTGKLVFEEKIKQRFNDALAPILGKKASVRRIYFTKFVIQ